MHSPNPSALFENVIHIPSICPAADCRLVALIEMRSDETDQGGIDLVLCFHGTEEREDLVSRNRASIRTVLGQGLEDVCNFDDAGFERYFPSEQVEGISIPSRRLMVLRRPSRQLLEAAYSPEDLVRGKTVPFHERPFCRSQFRRAFEHLIGDLEFADVMEKTCGNFDEIEALPQ